MVYLIILLALLIIVFVSLLVLYCYHMMESFQPECVEQSLCTCDTSSLRHTVLYVYWLYKTEPPLAQFDAEDITQRFKDVIDSGYQILNLAFYQYGDPDYVGSFGKFLWLPDDNKRIIVDYAHGRNVKILISIGGAAGTASFSGVDYRDIADDLETYINTYNLDGIDVDIEAPQLFPMITQLTNYLGQKWNGTHMITHAPQSANFSDNKGASTDYFTVYKGCGQYIDLLNVQFYNQGCKHETYEDIFVPFTVQCWNIAWISTGYDSQAPLGSVIPLDKIIVGKPICLPPCPYGGGNGFVDPNTLGQWFKRANDEIGWSTGLMIWAHVPDEDTAKNYLVSVHQGFTG